MTGLMTSLGGPFESSVRRRRIIAVVACVLALATSAAGATGTDLPAPSSPAATPRFDKWIIIGPGGGGAQFTPKISPHDPRTVLVSSDMSEGFVTKDGGNSWRQFNIRCQIRFFAFDPVDPNTAYANTIGLFRTTDGAKTWQLVYPDSSDVNGMIISGDHAGERLVTTAGGFYLIRALAVDPADSKTLYMALLSEKGSELRISKNWGKTWRTDTSLPGEASGVWIDAATPKDNRTIYISGANYIGVRKDGRWAFSTSKDPLAVVSLGFAVSGKPVIYAVTGAGWRGRGSTIQHLVVSEDEGVSWTNVGGGIVDLIPGGAKGVRFYTVATCPTRPEIAYVSYKGPLVTPGKSESYCGVAKTTDKGKTWELVWADAAKSGPNIKDGWLEERFGPEWGENPIGLDVAAKDAAIVYATDLGRTMRTTDGGKTWAGVYSKRMPNGAWTTTGLDMTTCYGVYWDPFNPKRMFICYTDIGLMASDDGGTSWKSASADGAPEDWANTTYALVFDPDVRGRCWAAMSDVHDLPYPKMWRGGGVRGYAGGVVESTDSGHTWHVSGSGMHETAATDIILDPKSPKGARVLYVAGLGTGVWKSSDGGKTWSLKNKGIAGTEPFAWRIVMDTRGTLYAVVARRSENGHYGDAQDGALYRSIDGAETWERINLPERVTGPRGIAADPRDPNRLYLAVWGLYNGSGDTDGGIFLSTDAGKSWKNIFDKQQHIYDITIDPKHPDTLYAGSMTFAVWRSTDRGATWARVKGYNFKQSNRVMVDPFHDGMIYVTTFGGSVWYGPGAGDPNAVEDITTPVMKY